VRINDGLGESEQGFARTVHRHHLRLRIEAIEAIAPAQPCGQAAAQFGAAESGRIARQSGQVGAQRILDESRCGVLRLADRQPDLTQAGVWRDVGESCRSFSKG
jgi:hypothetical protein